MTRAHASVIAAVALVLGAACGADDNPAPGSPECATWERSIDFTADPTFTPDERAALDGAAQDWGMWSGGRVRLVVRYGEPVGVPARLIRTTGDQPPIATVETQRRERFHTPDYNVLAITTGDPPRIYIAIERFGTEALRPLAAHEMGHAVGLRWPDCEHDERAAVFPDGSKDCLHAGTPDALMAPALTPTTAWSDADLAMCRASCLCN